MNGFRETALRTNERTNGRTNERDSLGLFSANRRETKKLANFNERISIKMQKTSVFQPNGQI